MATKLPPRLDMLPMAQRRRWNELAAVPAHFVLHGGTALAAVDPLHLPSLDDAAARNQPHEPGRDG
jgi:hypothetical protein